MKQLIERIKEYRDSLKEGAWHKLSDAERAYYQGKQDGLNWVLMELDAHPWEEGND